MVGVEVGMPHVRSSGLVAVALSCALAALAVQARAADQGIAGRKLLLRSTPKLVLLAKDPGISLMGSDPVGGADSSITFDDGVNAVTVSLPASHWRTNGSATVFSYRNSAAPDGPSAVSYTHLTLPTKA
jgi:hypothetical protein